MRDLTLDLIAIEISEYFTYCLSDGYCGSLPTIPGDWIRRWNVHKDNLKAIALGAY